MTIAIGLTGGIGSGKSTIRKIFDEFHISTTDADKIIHDAYRDETNELFQLIVSKFGESCIKVINGNKEIDRNVLREILEKNNQHTFALEVVTPYMNKKIMEFIQTNQDKKVVVLEIPLLIEAKMTHLVDKVLVVDVSKETQIKRVKERNKFTEEQINLILKNQANRELRLSLADDVILNEGKNLEQLKAEVKNIIQKYSKENNNIAQNKMNNY
jgi:dephospho-CoA kinase